MSSSATNRPLLRRAWLLPVAVLVLAFHVSPFDAALDRALLDAASRHPLRPPPMPSNSALVLVDQQTMDVLGREPYAMRWPFPRAAFAALIAALDRAGAERIVVDFTFFDQSESAEQDLLLAATAAAARQTVLGRTQKQEPVFWDAAFRQAHAEFFRQTRSGGVEFHPDSDGVARSYPVRGSLAAAAFPAPPADDGGLLRWHGGLKQIAARGVPLVPAGHFIIAGLPIVDRLSQVTPDFSPEGFARALAAEPRLTGAVFDLVRGRTVFVGTNVSGTFDVKPMPVGELEPGVLLHWTAWTNLVAGGFITPLPRSASLALAALAAAGLLVLAGRRPGITAPVWSVVGFCALLLPVSYAGLSAGWFLAPATPVAAAVLTLLGVVAENFWAEQRRKREIQAMFGAYVDPAVVARLVREPGSIRLGGERRVATVFFSDLVGFTDLSEKLRDEPERMVEIVNAYLDETSECLHRHGAYVDKYIGDAVMAVFGAPQAQADHAAAACAAALEAVRALDGINARYASVGVKLEVRIGLNTGEMIVGNLGSARKRNYTVMGDAVNLASRLEGANKEFGTSILLGEETARLVQGKFATRPLTRLRVKGKQTAVEVHELVGAPGALTPAQRDFLAAYRAGYAHFTARRFAEAEDAFARARTFSPEDEVTIALQSQAETFKLLPPGADWEPVLTLKTK
ncbi:MAG: adenylate/guanylate cyclase domain-containing protein [Opitutae bacterium]|nr:adenylate/guanylate cyclase domain-containing protein [Opitutae bacterium]